MLRFLRKFHLASGLSLFAGFALLLVQCTPQEVTVTPDCTRSNLPFDIHAVQNLPLMTEHALEMIRCSKKYFNFQNIDEMNNHFFGENKFPKDVKDKVKAELDIYNNLGFASYMDRLRDDGKISTDLRAALATLETDVNRLIHVEKPTINGFNSFYANKLSQIQQSNLCQSDKDLMSLVTQTLDGTTKFFFKHNKEGVASRDCDRGEFWLKLGCVLFTVVVLAVIYLALVALFALLIIASGGGEVPVTVDGVPTGGTVDEFEMAGVFGFLIGVFTGAYWYNLCCKWDAEIDCSPPTGMYYTSSGCNNYNFVVYGPGAYGATTWGLNTNALPEAAITTTPFLTGVSSIVPSNPVTIVANTLCVNNEGAVTLPISSTVTLTSSSTNTIPSMNWEALPPQNPQREVQYDLSLNTILQSVHTYAWEATQTMAFTITPVHPPHYWKIRFHNGASGTHTIRFNVTNTCTGETKSLVKDFSL